MRFKEWITKELSVLSEQEWFSFPNQTKIGVMVSDEANGPYHTEFFTVTGIDMRFEDWRLEPGGQQSPPMHFSAPITMENGQSGYINFTNAYVRQKAVIEPEARHTVIRNDWARFAIFYDNNTVVKDSQFEEERERVRNSYQFKTPFGQATKPQSAIAS